MKISLLLLLLLLTSCSKSLYIYKQAIGQISLEINAKENDKILKDPKIDQKIKDKISKIQQYKKYFFDYFKKDMTSIYDETTFLKQKAVTYLVIASPYNKVEPLRVSFPTVGSFPYLGFFEKEDALEYEKEKQNEGYDTFVRPVYAYSTLNQWIFNDNILSSFFNYNDHDLAELIFHELVHTIFFVKNEVSFNESLAQYFGERLTEDYYHYSDEKKEKLKKQKERRQEYGQMISYFAKELNQIYSKEQITRDRAKELFKNYHDTIMESSFNKFCETYKISDCSKLNENWNNARLAAYLTYQKEQNLIEKIHKKYNFSLKKLLEFFEKQYKVYLNSQSKSTFTKFLKQQENL